MRLINTIDLSFKEFFNTKDCSYAIVSHRWTNQEVSYEEFSRCPSDQRSGYGWTKILSACEIAKYHHIEWVWIDSCCIDKRSSAELTEVINSMYNLYAWSQMCFAFLSDVDNVERQASGVHWLSDTAPKEPVVTTYKDMTFPVTREKEAWVNMFRAKVEFHMEDYRNSEWFRRGWTLQELLAPNLVCFFNKRFEFIGSKSNTAGIISGMIAEIMNIHPMYLNNPYNIQHASIGERMKWASSRKTTRSEDRAYCLLGLLGVNMPLLYGEGGIKAFIRLQLELIRQSDDESIFAWEYSNRQNWAGLLAFSPMNFCILDGLSVERTVTGVFRHPYAMTNKGIELTLDLPQPLSMALGEQPAPSSNYSTELSRPILLPLRCIRKAQNGTWERPAVAFAAKVTSIDNKVMEGRRMRLHSFATDMEGLSLNDERLWRSPTGIDPWACVVRVHTGLTERWKVYFSQDGVNTAPQWDF